MTGCILSDDGNTKWKSRNEMLWFSARNSGDAFTRRRRPGHSRVTAARVAGKTRHNLAAMKNQPLPVDTEIRTLALQVASGLAYFCFKRLSGHWARSE